MQRLALLIRTPTWEGRSGRDALDMALAAAVMNFELDLFFLGAGVHQLIDDRDPASARLPKGYRAWASLVDFTETRYFADAERLDRLHAMGVSWLIAPTALSAAEMAVRQTTADRVWVLP